MEEIGLIKIVKQSLLTNKQANNNKLWREERIHTIYFFCIQYKIMSHVKKEENMINIQRGKKQATEIACERSQILDLTKISNQPLKIYSKNNRKPCLTK